MDINDIVTEKDLDEILESETPVEKQHSNHLVTDKIVYPKSAYFGQKGESYMLYLGGGEEQWYFRPKAEKGSEDVPEFIRVKWYTLESNVAEGNYGKAKYIGLNPTIYGKVGELTYTSKKWVFHYDGEKYNLVNPESVEIL